MKSIRILFAVLLTGLCLPLLAINPHKCCSDPAIPCKTKAERCSCQSNQNSCECKAYLTGAGSINFAIKFPGLRDGDRMADGVLKFMHTKPGVTMFTPQGLDFISAANIYVSETKGDWGDVLWASQVDYQVDSDGTLIWVDIPNVSPKAYDKWLIDYQDRYVEVKISDENGYAEVYRFWPDSSTAYNRDAPSGNRLRKLDAEGNYVTDAVPSMLEYVHDGKTMLIDVATGSPISETDEYGRVILFDDVDVVRSTSGVIEQIRYPGGLIDFEVIDSDFEYEVRFYREADFSYDEVDQLYVLNEGVDPIDGATKRYNLKNPTYDSHDIDETLITRYWDGRTTQWQFQYYDNSDMWELRVGEVVEAEGQEVFQLLRREQTQDVENQDGTSLTHAKRVYDASGALLSEDVEIREKHGDDLEPVEIVDDPTGANLITRYGYYDSGDNAGELKYSIEPTGQWAVYEYDSSNRLIRKVESWLDASFDPAVAIDFDALAVSAKSTEFGYSPVDPLDDYSIKKDDLRAKIVRIKGTLTSVQWMAFYVDANGREHEVEERATVPSAAYGDATNLRSEKIYYAAVKDGEAEARAGRLMSRRDADGTLLVYDYSRDVDGNFIVTEDHNHVDAPNGLAFKSTRREKTYDGTANLIRDEMFVYDGSSYQSLYYLTHAYDQDRNRIESRRFDGIEGGRVTYSATYSHGKAVTATDEAGRAVNTVYNVLDQKELENIVGSMAAGVGDVTKFYQYSTAATGCGCSASEVTITDESGTLTMTEVNEADRAKRKTRMVDVNGLETTYEYADGGRVTTETRPDGSTRITTNYLDGRVKSVAGTAVIPEYYTYGVNTDGTTWTRVDTADDTYIGTEDVSAVTDLRYRKMTDDMAGRILRKESPAFGGNVFLTEYVYDDYGRLESQSQSGRADARYEYDSMGNRVRSGLDVDDNGQLDLASEDRITDSSRMYSVDAGAWFDVSITTVYPTANDSTGVTASTKKRRLSGFSGSLASETITSDVHGNETILTVEVDRANKTVTRTTDTSDSTVDAVTVVINGYLKAQNSNTVAAARTYGYDGLGRRSSVKDPRYTQASTTDYYAGTRQVFTKTDAAGNTTAFTYVPQGSAGAGKVASVTDSLMQKSYRAYDLIGREIRTWGETDYPREYTYNVYGELATLTTYSDAADAYDFTASTWPNPTAGSGGTTTWTYDAGTGLLTRKEYADGNGTDYAYDSANRLSVRIWARNSGLDTTYGYDAATGELLTVDYEEANTADITYTYDRLGRPATVADATGTRTFSYDPATLDLTTESLDATFYDGLALSRSYDSLGRNSGYSLLDSAPYAISAVNYTYGTSGRLATVSDGTDIFTYSYKPNSNLLASMSGPVHTVNYSYAYEPDSQGNPSTYQRDLMTVIDNQVSGSSLSKYAYTYDALGRRDARTQSGSATANSTDDFSYNSRSEVISSSNSVETAAQWHPVYTYDKIGNRLTASGGALSSTPVSYTANALNQYTAIDSATPTHDLDGNLTSNGGNWIYTWNNENRLSSATDGATTISFTYDYQGRLVKKDDGTNVEVYVYDGWNRIFSISNPGSQIETTTSFLWGLDLSGSMQGAGGVGGLLKEGNLYPTYDANGNIMQKLDGAGAAAMSVDYDPFGHVIDGTLVGEYGFSTKPLSDGLDWYYYGFRYYDPVTGRWPNRDPVHEHGGINLYGMVDNNLVNVVDKHGLSAYEESGSGTVTVKSCNVVIFYGHGIATLDSNGNPVDWDSLTDEQIENTAEVPHYVKNEPCSSAEVFGCNTGHFSEVEQETTGAENPTTNRQGNNKKDLAGLWSRSRKEAARICTGKQSGGGSSSCCKSVTITFDCSGLPFYQRTSHCGKTETVTCYKNQ